MALFHSQTRRHMIKYIYTLGSLKSTMQTVSTDPDQARQNVTSDKVQQALKFS